jgi:hypothetical protein
MMPGQINHQQQPQIKPPSIPNTGGYMQQPNSQQSLPSMNQIPNTQYYQQTSQQVSCFDFNGLFFLSIIMAVLPF